MKDGFRITIRESTLEERKSVGTFALTGANMKAEKYIVVDADHPEAWVGSFFMPNGGKTKAEAVFWAERWVSKNYGQFIRPDGWERIVGKPRST